MYLPFRADHPPAMGIAVLFTCGVCQHAEGYDQRGSGLAHVRSRRAVVSSLDCRGRTWLDEADLHRRRQEGRAGSGWAHFRGWRWRSASGLDDGERNPGARSRSAGQSHRRTGPKANATRVEAIFPWHAETASRSRRAISTLPSPKCKGTSGKLKLKKRRARGLHALYFAMCPPQVLLYSFLAQS